MTSSRVAVATVGVGLGLFTVGAALTWPPLLMVAGVAVVAFGLVGIDVDTNGPG